MAELKQEINWCSSENMHAMPDHLLEYLQKETINKPHAEIIWDGKKTSVRGEDIRSFTIKNLNPYDKINTNEVTITEEVTEGIMGGGNVTMNDREYVDAKINALETTMNHKFQSQGELFTEKLSHVETKMDKNHEILATKIDSMLTALKQEQELQRIAFQKYTDEKLNALSEKLDKKQKEDKNSMWIIAGVVAAIATLVVTIVIPFFT